MMYDSVIHEKEDVLKGYDSVECSSKTFSETLIQFLVS